MNKIISISVKISKDLFSDQKYKLDSRIKDYSF